MSGVHRIHEERIRQTEAEGWTSEHDDGHADGDLASAARCYVWAASICTLWRNEGHADGPSTLLAAPPSDWPWAPEWWKPSDDPIRNLEKAGALIAAEIDRLGRAMAPAMSGDHDALVERLRDAVVPGVPIVGGYLGGEALAAADEIERLSALSTPPPGPNRDARPGGWVDGIGWVARLCDLDPCDVAREVHESYEYQAHDWPAMSGDPTPVIVTRWADGTAPTPPPVDAIAAAGTASSERAVIEWWLADEHGELATALDGVLVGDLDGSMAEALLCALRHIARSSDA